MTSEPFPAASNPQPAEQPIDPATAIIAPGVGVEPVVSSADSISSMRRRFGGTWVGPFLRNRKAILGSGVLLLFLLAAALAPQLAEFGPKEFAARPNQAPSTTHWVGTDGQGRDVFSQLVWGARKTLRNGFLVGVLTTVIGCVVGLSAGYFRGIVDDTLSTIMNVFLIIPSLPLLVVLAAFLADGVWIIPESLTVVLVLAVTGWAWPARVLRSQMLSLREKDFVSAAVVSGESRLRIIFREIFPNMTSIVLASFLGSTVYAIGAEAGLEFLGLGDLSTVSWGTILYWAQNNSGLLLGAWWTFIPAGICIALVAFSLVLMNYAMDEITNPRLRAQQEAKNALKESVNRSGRATPVLRPVEHAG
jgi:peptide/nickel transport system permease protein